MFCQRRISRSYSEESAQSEHQTDITSCLMEKFVLLLVLLSPAASVFLDVVQVEPGHNATLPCRAGNVSIRGVEWTRPDLEPEYVLLYKDGHTDPAHQHPSFKDRVQLVDRELKDGDVSLILKNVSRNDNGTYECRVAADGSRRKRALIKTPPIKIYQLEVSAGDQEGGGEKRADTNGGNKEGGGEKRADTIGGNKEGGGEKRADTNGGNKEGGGEKRNVGLGVGLTVFAVLLAAVAVVGTMIFKKRTAHPAGNNAEEKQLTQENRQNP